MLDHDSTSIHEPPALEEKIKETININASKDAKVDALRVQNKVQAITQTGPA